MIGRKDVYQIVRLYGGMGVLYTHKVLYSCTRIR